MKNARAADERIRAVVRAGAGERLPFFCECQQDGCSEVVWLSLLGFQRLLNRRERVVADVHAVVRPYAGAPSVR